MPSCSTATNPKGIKITFTEEDHRYFSIIDGKEIEYTSGTTFVSKFFPKFDPDGKIAERCAKKEGLTVEAIQAKWKKNANESCVRGTKVHEICEDILLKRPLRPKIPKDIQEEMLFKRAEGVAKNILNRASEVIGVEKIVFDPGLKIAGSIDLLIRAKNTGELWICDHKTNKEIETENKWNKFALSPIKHIADTNYFHYQLQLNLYEYLLKYGGYIDKNEKVNKVLFHISENGAKSYVLGDYQTEIEDMLRFDGRIT